MDGRRQRGQDLGPFDDEKVDADVDAATFGRAIEEWRVTVEDPVLVVAADSDRRFGLGDGLEEVLGEPGDIVDIEVCELAVGLSEVEDHHFPAVQIERHDRSHLVCDVLQERQRLEFEFTGRL